MVDSLSHDTSVELWIWYILPKTMSFDKQLSNQDGNDNKFVWNG